jgi:hypothetical protein
MGVKITTYWIFLQGAKNVLALQSYVEKYCGDNILYLIKQLRSIIVCYFNINIV